MDYQTFSSPQVTDLLANFRKIRVDVTSNDSRSQELMQRYRVIAPPSIVMLTTTGQVVSELQITGFIASNELTSALTKFRALERNAQQCPVGDAQC
jgi:thiol:disulfide interchange protein DsbD